MALGAIGEQRRLVYGARFEFVNLKEYAVIAISEAFGADAQTMLHP
jgi:hypothetical protein